MKTKIENDKIDILFSIWEGIIRYSNTDGRTDANKASETILLKILKVLHKKDYEDLNQAGTCGGIGRMNFPAADIGCLGGCCYSITSEKTKEKIKNGLRKFKEESLITSFPEGIKFYILDLKYRPKFTEAECRQFSFSETQVCNFSNLLAEIKQAREIDAASYEEIKQILVEEFISILPSVFRSNNINEKHIEAIERGLARFDEQLRQYEFRQGFGSLKGISGLISDLNLCSQGDYLWERFAVKLNSILTDFNIALQKIDLLNEQNEKKQWLESAQSKYRQISSGIDRFEAFLKSANHSPDARTPVMKSIASIKALLEKYRDE